MRRGLPGFSQVRATGPRAGERGRRNFKISGLCFRKEIPAREDLFPAEKKLISSGVSDISGKCRFMINGPSTSAGVDDDRSN